MADGFIHTVHKNGNWQNEVEGARGETPAAIARSGRPSLQAAAELAGTRQNT